MQAEAEVKENGSYHSNVIEASTEYQFDKGELAVEVPHGENIVTIQYRKPELDHYLARQKAFQSKTRIVDGAMVGSGVKHDADTDFFDLIVLGAQKRKADGIKVEKEYDADECRRFPYELKVRFVKRITTWKFKVEASGDELLEPQGALVVTQTIGEVNGVPVEIVYTMNPLQAKQRQSYENSVNSRTRFKNGDQSIETEAHFIEKAIKLFGGDRNGTGASFVSLTGGRLESGPFMNDRKAEFIAQIDPLFQMGVIDAICDYYRGGSD
jgi:hypothetical protein